MRSLRRDALVAGMLAFASRTSAQVNTVCPTNDVCFKLNIPDNTASSGNGDIFFQLSAPSSYEYVALGQGDSMSGSNIFIVYTSGDGNVTISPRLGVGEQEPSFNSDAQVTLLEGSGVSNGKMVANVRCASCNSWGSGGSASFSGGTGNWIYAFRRSGGPKDTTSQSASLTRHDSRDAFEWSYASAKGGNSVNPFANSVSTGSGTATASGTRSATSCVPRPVSTTGGGSTTVTSGASAGTSSGSATSTKTKDDDDDHSTRYGHPTGHPSQWGSPRPTQTPYTDNDKREEKRQEINYCDDDSNSSFRPIGSTAGRTKTEKMLVAHGVLAALAFVVFFPVGAIAIRLASFTGVVWFHAAFQAFAYLVYIIAFGLGISVANDYELWDEGHPIIGIVVFVGLFFQPIFGLLHHSAYKKYHARTFWSHSHLWLGRSIITLGIINGGLGFKLADKMGLGSKPGMIAYSVVAGVIWLAWVAASIIGERRRSNAAANAPPKYTERAPESPRPEVEERSNVPHPHNGHYAPK